MSQPNSGVNEMTAKPGELSLLLNGVDHTARPTWKLRETVEFYRDMLARCREIV